jgi:AcrR family transcriptional regulator
MSITLRALRAHLLRAGHLPLPLTKRQQDTRARILTLAQCLMAEFGAKSIKFTPLAEALRISPATLRFHFADHDDLLAALLTTHLETIQAALAVIPDSTPNMEAARRAAYHAATRTPSGDLTEAHRLFVRDRHTLHPDERAPIETTRHQIATALNPQHPLATLAVLDRPGTTQPEIENTLARLATRAAAPPPSHQAAPPIPKHVAPPPSLRADLTRHPATPSRHAPANPAAPLQIATPPSAFALTQKEPSLPSRQILKATCASHAHTPTANLARRLAALAA